jgi:hypothetical protein
MRSATLPLLFVVGCSQDWYEIARVRAPDGRLDAVLQRSDGNATTSFYYQVLLAPAGQAATASRPVVVANLYGAVIDTTGETGVDLKWPSPDTLSVQYFSAKESAVVDPMPTFGGARVHVVLKSCVLAGATAKCCSFAC